MAELAAKAGHSNVRVCVIASTRNRLANAFALFPNTVIMTETLVQTLARREVDAIVGHELSHLRRRSHGIWIPFAVAAVFFHTAMIDIFTSLSGNIAIPVSGLLLWFLFILYMTRRREFAADAGSMTIAADPRAMISGLARLARFNAQPLEFGTVGEWFSTHPSTEKRIRALAAKAGLGAEELEALCRQDDDGERYALPGDDPESVFNVRWQAANAGRYALTVIVAPAAAGLGAGLLSGGVAGIVVGCLATKAIAHAVMAWGYAAFGRKLSRKLGEEGILVGFAPGEQARVFDSYRFRDVGLLSFDHGQLRYRSERSLIALRPGDIIETALVAAAPSSWRRVQPMVKFQHPETGEVKAFILHSLDWDTSGKRLFKRIERWRGGDESSTESSIVQGFEEAPGQVFHAPPTHQILRGFRFCGALTFVLSFPEGMPALYALGVAAGAYAFMLLPAMLYRPQRERRTPVTA